MRKNNYSDNNIFEYYFVDKTNKELSWKIKFIQEERWFRLDVSEDHYYLRYSYPLNKDQEYMRDIIVKYSWYPYKYLSEDKINEMKSTITDILKRFEFDYFVPSEEMVTDDNIDEIEYDSNYTIRSLILLKHLWLSYKELDSMEEENFDEYSLVTARWIEYKVIPDSELEYLIEERLYEDLEEWIISMNNSIPRVEINWWIATVSLSQDIEVDASILWNWYEYNEENYNWELYYIMKMD